MRTTLRGPLPLAALVFAHRVLGSDSSVVSVFEFNVEVDDFGRRPF